MRKLRTLFTYISSNRIWLVTLACLELFFVFLAWFAYPENFLSLVGLMIFVSLAALILPLVISIYKRKKIDIAFRCFLLEPDDRNEYLLCESVPASMRPYLRELGQHLRTQQEYGKEQKLKIADYENYIEKWAHEIKKPLSLMTLLLDNRKGKVTDEHIARVIAQACKSKPVGAELLAARQGGAVASSKMVSIGG